VAVLVVAVGILALLKQVALVTHQAHHQAKVVMAATIKDHLHTQQGVVEVLLLLELLVLVDNLVLAGLAQHHLFREHQ
jgi:hypothetical protein